MSHTDWLILAAFVIIELLCSLEWANDAHAAEPELVTAKTVCGVQSKIRWREAAWTPEYCETVAAALNETATPVRTLAIAINESDLRARAINVTRPGVYDMGLMGVRCVTIVALAEATGASSAGANSGPTSKETLPRDRCTNGPARGLYAHQLFDVGVNIRTGEAVLKSKKRLGHYNAKDLDKAKRYERRIRALELALLGLPWKAGDPRTRKLCRQITEALEMEIRS